MKKRRIFAIVVSIAFIVSGVLLLSGCKKKGEEVESCGLKINFLVGDDPVSKADAEFIQSQWKQNLGVDSELIMVPFKTRLKKMQDGDFQVVEAGWGPDYNDPMTYVDLFESTNANNHGKYSNPEVDKLIEQARKASTVSERFKCLADAEKIAVDDCALFPLFLRKRNFIEKSNVHNVVRRIFSDIDVSEASVDGRDEIVLNLGEEPPKLNSTITTDSVSGDVLRHCMEGLTRINKDGEVEPAVAESWSVSEDQLTWTFKIRDGAKWSDGSPVTAHDFEFAYKTVLDPNTASEYATIMYCFKNAKKFNNGECSREEVGIRAIDDYTIELNLEYITPYIPSLVAFYVFLPVKEEFYKKVGGDKYATEPDLMLYNGPFIMKSWEHNSKILLEKNDNYWNRQKVKLNKVLFKMIKDPMSAYSTYKTGELDSTGVNTPELRQLAKGDGENIKSIDDGSVWYLEFNFKDKVLSNKNIRKALSLAIDKVSFVENVRGKESAEPVYTLTPRVIIGEDGKPGSYTEKLGNVSGDFNVEEARKYLEQGLKELGLKK